MTPQALFLDEADAAFTARLRVALLDAALPIVADGGTADRAVIRGRRRLRERRVLAITASTLTASVIAAAVALSQISDFSLRGSGPSGPARPAGYVALSPVDASPWWMPGALADLSC